MRKIINRLSKFILQNTCKHNHRKIIAFEKREVEYDSCYTVSYKYNILTIYRCEECRKEFQERSTE